MTNLFLSVADKVKLVTRMIHQESCLLLSLFSFLPRVRPNVTRAQISKKLHTISELNLKSCIPSRKIKYEAKQYEKQSVNRFVQAQLEKDKFRAIEKKKKLKDNNFNIGVFNKPK